MLAGRIHSVAFRTSELGGALAVLFFPVSVSVSQIGLFLAIAGWMVVGITVPYSKKPENDSMRMPFALPAPLLFGLSIYIFLIISLFYNSYFSDNAIAFIRKGFRTEIKDMGMVFLALWIVSYTDHPERKQRVYGWIKFAVLVILATGFISIFSKFRLSKYPHHILQGWVADSNARYQHHLMVISGIHIYLPIGLMNTHLTYAAQLGYAVPFLMLRVVDPFIKNIRIVRNRTWLFSLLALAAALLVLVLNNGRSALLGIGVTLGIAILYFVRVHWKRRSWILLVALLGVLFFFGAAYGASSKVRGKVNKVVSPLIFSKEKHTDYQRAFLWQGTAALIQENPIFGVGAGHFNRLVEKKTMQFSQEWPELWYGYAVIQRGHAHNDILHLQTIGGIFPVAAYMLLWFSLIYIILGRFRSPGHENPLSLSGSYLNDEYWKFAPLILMFAGLFQCYFQDDETLIPFWIFVGLSLRGYLDSRKTEIESIPN